MSSMGVQRSLTPQPLNQPTSPRPLQGSPPVSPTQASAPSGRMQQQVQARQQQSQQHNALSGQSALQHVQQSIQATPTQTLIQNSAACLRAISSSQLAQHLLSGGHSAVEMGAQVHDLTAKIPMTEELGEVMEALTEKFELGETEIPTAEAKLFEHLTGISTDSMSSLKQVLETGQQVLQVAKTAQCLNQAYQAYGTPDFSSKIAPLARESYVTLGGQTSLDLSEKVSDFCQKRDLDSGKEVVSALAKFSTDDSLIATAQRSTLSYLSAGSSVGGVLGKSIPFLNYGVAVIDTGLAAKSGYDWWNGKSSGTELCKSGVTAMGSVLGSTVAPVIGPLLATGVNYGISSGGSMYSQLSNWWSGTTP